MTVRLDRLAQLAHAAGDGLGEWWTKDEFAEGFPIPPSVDRYLAECDPGTVAALVRAVQAAEALADTGVDEQIPFGALESYEYHKGVDDAFDWLRAALAPFHDSPGDAA